MFTVAADAAVLHADGPIASFINVIGGLTEAGHRFDTNRITLYQLIAAALFAIVGDFVPSPDEAEVSEGRYWSVKEIEDSFEKSLLTPNFEREFSMIKKDLEALL